MRKKYVHLLLAFCFFVCVLPSAHLERLLLVLMVRLAENSVCLFGNVSISHSFLRNDAVCKTIDCSCTYYSVVTSVDLLLFFYENSQDLLLTIFICNMQLLICFYFTDTFYCHLKSALSLQQTFRFSYFSILRIAFCSLKIISANLFI